MWPWPFNRGPLWTAREIENYHISSYISGWEGNTEARSQCIHSPSDSHRPGRKESHHRAQVPDYYRVVWVQGHLSEPQDQWGSQCSI